MWLREGCVIVKRRGLVKGCSLVKKYFLEEGGSLVNGGVSMKRLMD